MNSILGLFLSKFFDFFEGKCITNFKKKNGRY